MKFVRLGLMVISLALATGCGGDGDGGGGGGELPACDTLTTVWFVSRCDDAVHARCALFSTAPAGATASGCVLTIIAMPGGPELVECVETCP